MRPSLTPIHLYSETYPSHYMQHSLLQIPNSSFSILCSVHYINMPKSGCIVGGDGECPTEGDFNFKNLPLALEVNIDRVSSDPESEGSKYFGPFGDCHLFKNHPAWQRGIDRLASLHQLACWRAVVYIMYLLWRYIISTYAYKLGTEVIASSVPCQIDSHIHGIVYVSTSATQ
jgi:hypothetical protein